MPSKPDLQKTGVVINGPKPASHTILSKKLNVVGLNKNKILVLLIHIYKIHTKFPTHGADRKRQPKNSKSLDLL
jgi:hypothetical protein